ncbi:MAG: hypothetical protein ABW133_15250 [Polyangiaceae bacterium]
MTNVGAVIIGVVAVGAAVYAASHRARASTTTAVSNARDGAAMAAVGEIAKREATTLAFRDLVEPTPRALKPTARARDLAGQRVRMTGFMAEMELAPKGAFYLTPIPIRCDEAGGGTADLPPTSVLVVVPTEKGRKIDHVAGELEATGTWEVGNRADEEGRISAFRIVTDEPWPAARSTEKTR